MKRSVLAFSVGILLISFTAFAASKNESTTVAPQSLPTVTAAPQQDATLSGRVVETMDSGGYTYVQIEKNGKKTWVAVPQTEIKVGQQVTFLPGNNMGQFTSRSLKRTFDDIIFSAGLAGAEHAKTQAPKKKTALASTEKIRVEKASGPNGFTVSEIHEKAGVLNQKTVVVRGKVVKVSEGIMGKNWIHLQDGTGDVTMGNNKLVVTSQDLPAVGDVVTMKGVIYKDKDFGSGYRYNVIMEQASIQH
jgi:hypothetical protein